METSELLRKTKADVRSVLITSKRGYSIGEFRKVFKELTDYHIPFLQLGFVSLEEFLSASSDVCACEQKDDGTLCLTAVCDARTNHVKQLVDRSRDSSRKNRADKFKRTSFVSSSVPPAFRLNLLKLLDNYPDGILVDELSAYYYNYCGEKLSASHFGFSCMRSMLESIPRLVHVEDTANGTMVLPVLMNDVNGSHLIRRVSNQSPGEHLQFSDTLEPLKQDIIKVLRRHKRPVCVIDLSDLYFRCLGRRLEFVELGFSTLLDTLVQLGSPVQVHKRLNEWYCLVKFNNSEFDGDNTLNEDPHSVDTESGGNLASPISAYGGLHSTPIHCNTSGTHNAINSPVNQRTAEATYRFQFRPPELLVDGQQQIDDNRRPLVNILIVSITSPSLFTFRTCSWHAQLLQLQTAMNTAYQQQGDVLDLDIWCPGLPVAVCVNSQWCRAVIVSQILNQIRVYLLDHGRSRCVSTDHLKPLFQRFAQVPVLCAEGSLADVSPGAGENDCWSSDAITLFSRTFSANTPVTASVLRQNDCVSLLRVCDTSGMDDVYACDLLVDCGLAVKCDNCVNNDDDDGVTLKATVPTVLFQLYNSLNSANVDTDKHSITSSDLSGISTFSDGPHHSNTSELLKLKSECYDMKQRVSQCLSARLILTMRARIEQLERRIAILNQKTQ